MSAEQGPQPQFDIINTDEAGRAHRPNGEFMSSYEQNIVAAHADTIIDSLDGHDTVANKIAADQQAAEQQEQIHDVFDSINGALASGTITEFSAGPDYRKATGLSREDVLKLGFNSFSDLTEAAKQFNQEEQARFAAGLEAEQKAVAIAERQERANEAAAQWRREADELQGKLPALEPEAPLTYKEKLARGGEIGVAREQAAKESAHEKAEQASKDAASARWAERNSKYDIVRDEAAEARQSDLVALLKAHQAAVLTGANNQQTPEQVVASYDHEPTIDPLPEAAVVNNDLSYDTIEPDLSDDTTGYEDFDHGTIEANNEPTIDPIEVTVDQENGEPAITEKGIRARFKNTMLRAAATLSGAKLSAKNWINDTANEGEQSKRRKAIVGVAVVAGSAVLLLGAKYGFDSDGPSGPDTVLDIPDITDAPTDGPSTEPVDPAAVEPQAPADPETIATLEAGQNPWSESIDYAESLGYNTSSVEFVDAVKDDVLRLNNVQDPTNLAIGTQLTMPTPQRLAELYELYGKS